MAILSTADLRRSLSARRVRSAVLEGRLVRVRPGWYATPETDPVVMAAVRAGGTLTCGAALRRHGVWVLDDAIHVRVPASSRVHSRAERLHRLSGTAQSGIDDVATALRVAVECFERDAAVCSVDSALNQGLVSELAPWSPRSARVLALADGRSQSGLETLARLRLRRRGVRVTPQVFIAGIGRVDLLIGDRLVIELDGDRWHSDPRQREIDRRRDSGLAALGYHCVRAGAQRVLHDWAPFEAEVMTMVRRRDHRWRGAHRMSGETVRRG